MSISTGSAGNRRSTSMTAISELQHGRRAPALPPWRLAASALGRVVLKTRRDQAPPARTRRAIAEAEAESEVLVGATQVAAIIGFALLYAVSPRAFPPDVPFEPVPWALGAYALFTVLRLALAWRRRLTPAFLALSIVVDMAVLMLTIWSFHLQYGAPAALYIKAPTLMYAFILIALRALRFEARWVLLAGGVAMVGWLMLVAFAVLIDPAGLPVTRSYVEYMTSYRILVGAEIDKLVSMAMVAIVLAVVVSRARAMLVEATTERLAGAELSRFFAPEVAATIKGADMAIAPGDGTLRDAAVMFVDLRGFTRLSQQLTPQEVMQLLGDYQEQLVPVIRAHGGSVDKFLGDGILASFGAVSPSTTFAADALRAGEALVDAAAAWAAAREARGQPSLRIGIGIAAGTILFGAVGHRERLEYTVIGDPVNLAAKLEAHTKILGATALSTRHVYDLAQEQGYQPQGPVSIAKEVDVAGVDRKLTLVIYGK
jgi:adenylate cyclase